jgi:thioredoxin reductase
MLDFDLVIIGGGPAGVAAAQSAASKNLKVLLLERESKLGGILKQCIHDGFGLLRFKEKLTGPEYASRFIKNLLKKIKIATFAFASRIEKHNDYYQVNYVDQEGFHLVHTKNIILATGCRERTRNQLLIPGMRGVGIYTAGMVQHLVNILGISPCLNPVIIGSGDIGLIMARRLTLEGAKVVGVYEIKDEPSGLMRNIAQCLDDYDIPLYLSKTVTKIIGTNRVEAVEISTVDSNFTPIPGTEEIVACDALVLAVGLIPENELAEGLNIKMDPRTKGPVVDQNLMTSESGIFACGNCLHVNDLVDYVSENAEIAAQAVKKNYLPRTLVPVHLGANIHYLLPQVIDLSSTLDIIFYFRSKKRLGPCKLVLSHNGEKVWEKNYLKLFPPEMERIRINLEPYHLSNLSNLEFRIEVK